MREEKKRNKDSKELIWVICPICKEGRWRTKGSYKFEIKHGGSGHCRICSNRIKTKFKQGNKHIHWKSGRSSDGRYIKLVISGLNEKDKGLAIPMQFINGKGSPRVYEHRLVMAKKLGRSLKKGEIVRHLNGDKHDNRPENLELGTAYDNTHDHMEILNENKKLKEIIKILKIQNHLMFLISNKYGRKI